MRLAVAVTTCVLVMLVGCSHDGAGPLPYASEDGATAADLEAMRAFAAGRRGFVVWESRRPSGTRNLKYRVWKRNLDGSGLAMISGAPGEANYAHLGPRISPDGHRIVFAGKRWNSSRDPATTTLWDDSYATAPFDAWVIEVDPVTLATGEPRELIALRGRVGTAGEDHVFEWKDADTLLVSIPDGHGVFEYDVRTDALGQKLVGDVPFEAQVSPGGRFVFSSAGAGARWAPIVASPDGPNAPGSVAGLDGCQVTMSGADDWLVWVKAYGPGWHTKLRRLDLATGAGSDIPGVVERLTPPYRYVYFPMLSRDGTLFALGASAYDERGNPRFLHSHAYADYEIFLVPWDSAACAPKADPVRYTFNARSQYPGMDETAGHVLDRWPDVWAERSDVATAANAPAAATVPGSTPIESGVLPEFTARLAAATEYAPIVAELERMSRERPSASGAEARRLVTLIEERGEAMLAHARDLEASRPGEAVEVLSDVRRRYRGLRWGAEADARLTDLAGDRRFVGELAAARLLDALRRADVRFMAGVERGDGWKPRHKVRAIAEAIDERYPATRANVLAGSVLAARSIARTTAADRIVAVVDAVVTRTSDARRLLRDGQYPEGLVCTEYKVDRVLAGHVAGERLITLQLARKGDALLEPSYFRPGDVKRLRLAAWDAQTAYQQHQIADDINDVDSPVYFVLRAESVREN